jgi:hypothetical protein
LEHRSEAGKVERVIQRRPTRRHRRNRKIRRVLLAVFCAGLAIGFASVALQHLSPSLFRASTVGPNRHSVELSRDMLVRAQQEGLRQMENRPVYPYSVVSGGVRDAAELKWAADHDPVVRAHYRGFDYEHARLVQLVLARTAYVSYRIGNKVYWTRHRVKLKKGETLITDGKITARSRCGNRVEEAPQQATSSVEPPAAKFEEPMLPATGTAVAAPPLPFQSTLLNRPEVPGLGPVLPLTGADPIGYGAWTPIAPPPLPSVCGVEKKKTGSTPPSKNGKGNPCESGGGGVVPEPSTWLLMAAGLAAIYWKTRDKFVRA